MKKVLFTGVCTALVTPFLGNHVNYPMLQQLLQHQLHSGIHTIVLGGTTGEAPTLSDKEKLEMYRCGKDYVGDEALIICGTGSNDTSHAVELSIAAQEAGADALLVVTPYYNKANPDGLLAHYLSIAHSVHIPLIVYNVPGRTGMDTPVSIYRHLSHIPNIAGVKEASTDIVKIAKIRNACGSDLPIWSGNDDQAVAAISLGAQGVISVVSNVKPVETCAMVNAALAGDFDTAAALQCGMMPLIEALFSEVNPIPVKTAMRLIGYDCGNCRLPLGKMENKNIETLKALLS